MGDSDLADPANIRCHFPEVCFVLVVFIYEYSCSTPKKEVQNIMALTMLVSLQQLLVLPKQAEAAFIGNVRLLTLTRRCAEGM